MAVNVLMSASTDFRIKQQWVIEFLTPEGCAPSLDSILWPGKQKAIHGISSSSFSECKEVVPSAKNSYSPSFGMQGACFTRNFWQKDQRWIPTAIVQLYDQSSNTSAESGCKETRFFCIEKTQGHIAVKRVRTPWEAWNSQWSTPFLRPRFGTVRILVVPIIEGEVNRSIFSIGCLSLGSCAQMDQQKTRNFLHGRNEQMDRTIVKRCVAVNGDCWKISVQRVREIISFILI